MDALEIMGVRSGIIIQIIVVYVKVSCILSNILYSCCFDLLLSRLHIYNYYSTEYIILSNRSPFAKLSTRN